MKYNIFVANICKYGICVVKICKYGIFVAKIYKYALKDSFLWSAGFLDSAADLAALEHVNMLTQDYLGTLKRLKREDNLAPNVRRMGRVKSFNNDDRPGYVQFTGNAVLDWIDIYLAFLEFFCIEYYFILYILRQKSYEALLRLHCSLIECIAQCSHLTNGCAIFT